MSPAIPTALLAPDAPQIGTMFVPNAAVTPTATVNLEWDMPQAARDPEQYAIQWALDGGFTSPTTLYTNSTRTNAAITGLPTGTAFWVRVAGVYAGYGVGPYSTADTDTTPSDTTAPTAATSLSTSWSGATGDLTIAYTPSTSTNSPSECGVATDATTRSPAAA